MSMAPSYLGVDPCIFETQVTGQSLKVDRYSLYFVIKHFLRRIRFGFFLVFRYQYQIRTCFEVSIPPRNCRMVRQPTHTLGELRGKTKIHRFDRFDKGIRIVHHQMLPAPLEPHGRLLVPLDIVGHTCKGIHGDSNFRPYVERACL